MFTAKAATTTKQPEQDKKKKPAQAGLFFVLRFQCTGGCSRP